MTGRYKALSLGTIVAAGALALAAFPAAAVAAAPASLCNGSGKVEVLSQPSSVDCGSGADQELHALLKARSEYQAARQLDWQTRALIDASIDHRLIALRREIHHKGGSPAETGSAAVQAHTPDGAGVTQ